MWKGKVGRGEVEKETLSRSHSVVTDFVHSVDSTLKASFQTMYTVHYLIFRIAKFSNLESA